MASTGYKTLALWDTQTGKQIRTLKVDAGSPRSVVFSPDGRTLASGGPDGAIRLWDVSSGQQLRSLSGHAQMPGLVSLSFDGKAALSFNQSETTPRLWDLANSGGLRLLKGHANKVYDAMFSPDGKVIATGSDDRTIRLWDAGTGRELRVLKGHTSEIRVVAFSADNKTLASASVDGTVKLWSVATGAELHTLAGHSGVVNSIVFDHDGKLLATASSDKSVRVWEVQTGKELRTLTGHSEEVTKVVFSPDGKTLASSDFSDKKLWDVSTGKELHDIRMDGGSIYLAFSGDGKNLLIVTLCAIKLWNVATGQLFKSLEEYPHCNGYFFFSILSTDGKTLASGGRDKNIELWDISNGTQLGILQGHGDDVGSAAFSSDGKTLLSSSADKTIKWWDVSTKRELASLVAIDGEDWLAITADGVFDGSPAAWSKILWRFSPNLYDVAPVEIFFNEFYYPGLLAEISAGKRLKPPQDISSKDRRQPHLMLSVSTGEEIPTTGISARKVRVKIEVADAPAGAQDVRLFRNGSLVRVWRGDVLKGQTTATVEATVPIVAGENRFTAYAFNRDNIKSADTELTITGAAGLRQSGVAYILAIGINEYANAEYNLRYAVADARDFAAEMQIQQRRLGIYRDIKIISLFDKAATRANIIESLITLAGQVQPEDIVILFFAGHGTAQQNRFYLIPHDLSYVGARMALDQRRLQVVLNHSISDRDLEAAFEGLDAGQLLLVIDAWADSWNW